MSRQACRATILLATVSTTLVGLSGCRDAGRRPLNLGAPSTVQDSGLLDPLLAEFERGHLDYRLRVLVAGSGELLMLAARGDVDVLLSHSPHAEIEFMESGLGLMRRAVMENDFVIVGPPSDPVGIRGMRSGPDAVARIAAVGAPFLSRGDDSGTHRKELELREIGGAAAGGPGYRELGQGMGPVLRAASELGGYTLTDRGTYLNQKETLDLEIMVEGNARLGNVYSVIVPVSARDSQGGIAFAEWLSSEEGQRVIRRYGVDRFGEPLFWPILGRRPGGLERPSTRPPGSGRPPGS